MKNIDKIKSFVEDIKAQMGDPPDFIARYYFSGSKPVAVVFLKDIVRHELISDNILRPLFLKNKFNNLEDLRKTVSTSSVCLVKEKHEVFEFMLIGYSVLITEEDKVLVFDTTLFPKRAPSEPPTSAVVKGPRNGFVDDITVNLAMIRKNLKTKNLFLKDFFIGEHTQTRITVAHINGVADKKIVDQIYKRIQSIKTDGIIDSYYIGQYIIDNPKSLFTQVGTCEKPDIATSRMLEGRIAIFVDNTPIVLTLPYIILEDLQNSNDYYQNYIFSSFIRLIRLFGVFMATVVPGLYLAFRLYHYKLIPLKFLVTISNTTQGLPFTPFVELFFILVLFELLYEVSLRLPQYLGLATSIVGALILGDTGVSAGLISPPGVMIVALSIICIYTMPDQRGQLSVLRVIFLLLGSTLGVVGVIIGGLLLISELSKLNSFDAPYLAPFAPFNKKDLKDGVVKGPTINQNTLPKSIPNSKQTRVKGGKNEKRN